jgi:hypothetical protein
MRLASWRLNQAEGNHTRFKERGKLLCRASPVSGGIKLCQAQSVEALNSVRAQSVEALNSVLAQSVEALNSVLAQSVEALNSVRPDSKGGETLPQM